MRYHAVLLHLPCFLSSQYVKVPMPWQRLNVVINANLCLCKRSEVLAPLHCLSRQDQLGPTHAAQVRVMLTEARENVKSLLTEKLQQLHALAGALLDQETLTADQISAVIAAADADGPGAGSSESGARGDDGSERGREQRVRAGATLSARCNAPLTRGRVASRSTMDVVFGSTHTLGKLARWPCSVVNLVCLYTASPGKLANWQRKTQAACTKQLNSWSW